MSKIKSVDLDAVITSVPLDKTAARVMGGGVHYEMKLKPAPTYIRASVDPLPTAAPDLVVKLPVYRELVGNTFGRWRVIGYAANQGTSNSKATWVVKCSCGRYEHRKAKSIRAAPTSGDCCAECRNLQYIKRAYRELGSKALDAFAESRTPVRKGPPEGCAAAGAHHSPLSESEVRTEDGPGGLRPEHK